MVVRSSDLEWMPTSGRTALHGALRKVGAEKVLQFAIKVEGLTCARFMRPGRTVELFVYKEHLLAARARRGHDEGFDELDLSEALREVGRWGEGSFVVLSSLESYPPSLMDYASHIAQRP